MIKIKHFIKTIMVLMMMMMIMTIIGKKYLINIDDVYPLFVHARLMKLMSRTFMRIFMTDCVLTMLVAVMTVLMLMIMMMMMMMMIVKKMKDIDENKMHLKNNDYMR